MTDAPTPHDDARTVRPSSSRRHLLTGAAGAVITGVAAGSLLGAEPAAAAVPDDASVTPAKFHPSAIDAAAAVASARTLGTGPTQAAPGTTKTSLNVKDFGAVGNGTTDDTAAIQACIDSVGDATKSGAPAGRIVFPTGVYRTTDTITIVRKGIILEGQGIGSWSTYTPNGSPNGGLGACIVYDGTTPKAIFRVSDSWFVDFRDLTISVANGKVASEGIYFGRDDGVINDTGTNAKCGVTKCRISNMPYGQTGETGRFTKGIRIGGSNGNNDEYRFDLLQIGCYTDAGMAVEATQSVWGSLNDVTFMGLNNNTSHPGVTRSAVGLRTIADIQLVNCAFNRNDVDIHVTGANQVNVFGMWSENARRHVLLDGNGGKVNITGGKLLFSTVEWAPGALPSIEHTSCGGGAMVRLDGLWLNNPTGTPHTIKVRGNNSSNEGFVSIKDCVGVSQANLDIAGVNTQASAGLDITIDSGGHQRHDHLVFNQALNVAHPSETHRLYLAKSGDTVQNDGTLTTPVTLLEVPLEGVQPGDVYRLRAWGQRLNNTGAATTSTLRLLIGPNAWMSTGAVSLASGANPVRWELEAELLVWAVGAHDLVVGYRQSPPVSSNGLMTPTATALHVNGANYPTESLHITKNLTVDVQHATTAAAGLLTTDRRGFYLERIR